MIIRNIILRGDWLNLDIEIDSVIKHCSVNKDKTPKAGELKEGQDISQDWIIKEWKDKTGETKYFLNEKKKGFPKKDYTLEKKFQALQAASRIEGLINKSNGRTKSDQIIQLAEKYLKWLNN